MFFGGKFYEILSFDKKENIESILKDGIIPKCGENTSLVESDIGNYIFLQIKRIYKFGLCF